jgi:large subunit ribosomal protein L7/L12
MSLIRQARAVNAIFQHSSKLHVQLQRRILVRVPAKEALITTSISSTLRRSFASEAAVNVNVNVTADADSDAGTDQYQFQHPKSKEMYDKMILLQAEDIKLISQLINDKLGITITEADKRGGMGSASSSSDPNQEGGEQEAVEAKTAFDLKLTGFDKKSKIKVIKEIRAITGLGLKEAKAMVDEAPKTVKREIKMEEAEELKVRLEAVGATVDIE